MRKFYFFASLFMGLLVFTGQNLFAQSVTGISLDKHTLNLGLWDSEQLTATITPSDAANKNVIWTTSNSKVADVDNSGYVSANHDGTAWIKVTTEDGGFSDSCLVTCTVNDAANIITFSFAGESHEASIFDQTHKVIGYVPYGTDASNLTVSGYEISPGASISPLPETVSDFSDTVSFVVTAPDGKTQKTWKVFPEVMPDLSGAQEVKLTFSTAPQGWIDDTVSWVEAGIHFHIGYPDSTDTSWPPSAEIGVDYDSQEMGVSLFPGTFQFYLEDTSKVIVAASMDIFENCGDGCSYAFFEGGNASGKFFIDPMTSAYYFFNLTQIKAFRGELRSLEGSFSGITFWIANKDGSVNYPPVANAGDDQTVFSGDTVLLNGSASFDPEQKPLTYSWHAPEGISLDDSTLMQPSFVAPKIADTLRLTFVLSVSDGTQSAEDSVVITVVSSNHPPVADAGPDQTVYDNDSVYLDGTGSYDADGDSLRYLWLAPGGIHLTDSTSPTPAFKVPDVQQTTVFSFALIVNDGLVNSLRDTVFITVKHENQRPVAWFDFDSAFVHEGDTAYLDGHYSYDPDGDSLRFHWWTDPGSGINFFDSTAMDVRCGTPMVTHDTVFRVYLKVDDGQLMSEPDTLYLKVMDMNTVPVAVLKKHKQYVYDGDTVYLDGTSSYDADGDSLRYKWTAPKDIWLSDSGATAWFVAPVVQKLETYYISLVVNDGESDSPPDFDTIVVMHKNHPPVAESGYPIEMFEGDSAYLYGSLSFDIDGDSLSYSWSVPTGFWIQDSTQPDSRFSAPQVRQDTTFDLILKVFDGQVWSEPDTCRVKVKNKNRAPVAAIVSTSPIFYGVTMNEGDTLWIDGSPSYDPDGDSITYDWALPKDFRFYHTDSVKVMIIAGEVAKTTSFDAALFVSDGVLRSSKDFIIQVLNVNKAPYARAGKSFSTLSGQLTELDASGSYDPDGDSVLLTWFPPKGISLDDIHAVSPVFQAPQVSADSVLIFKLVASDGLLVSDTSSVEVTVKPIEATLRVSATVNDTAIPYSQRHITLYWQDNNDRWVMESVLSYNDNGETYYAVWEGEWMITVDPVGDSAGFMTTFSGDVTFWSQANSFHVTGNTETQVTVRCVPVQEPLTGDGMIDGYIQRDTAIAGIARGTITHVDNNTSGDVPATGVAVYLYRTSDDVLLASSLTDDDGHYVFENLPFDAYYLLVQLPGYDANTPWPVEVTENDTVVSDVNFLVSEGAQEITDVNNLWEKSVKLYPNPVKDRLSVQLDNSITDAVIRLYDLTGHLILMKTVDNRFVQIDMSGLKKGFYLLRISNDRESVTRKLIKQ
ncbi:T9SS type A sorting domain-containing protein [Candidatus Sulfidibacterium hydrothermale]|uniref:PKD domain-containing protein n=1 Tax=Candidatus Sulfidibacterium hydrothermale TaxID=2875962 RepID=UPI001F0A7BF4|nr:Ig-like domain-containing protein [Candidatus Sulfidibacterium hydrothermale]UBM62999.1 T9SS type A sorting domain-containing protein [Candidatus Sulfidibacterium hydrothermale]